ncbi:FapA family protein [Desulfovibrio sp. OttesenSCG-928-O18]|nr:FapA family protein [Desulfovibrio sp. OttesenSCG-928-O18]
MPYYVRHYFQPDFNHNSIRPVVMADGHTYAHFLGYVQSVVAGQVLAELVYLDSLPEGCVPQDAPLPDIDPEELPPTLESAIPVQKAISEQEGEKQDYKTFLSRIGEMDPRFIYNNPVFPLGPNCERDPENPNRILSRINGFCFYHQGLITVKRMLNVRQDVNFRTGNIIFAGDILVHGDVYPGFRITGRNLRIKGRIDGGILRAGGTVVAESGIKGSPKAEINAQNTVRLANCEHARIITSGNCIIDGNCMHSDLFVGGSVIVKGRLQGGNVHSNGLVYVKEQLGSSQGAATRIALGYNPLDFLHLQELNAMQEDQSQRLQHHNARVRKGPHFAAESAPFQELATSKLAVIKTMQHAAWRKFSADMRRAYRTRVIVPGIVHPGVEISIGRAYSKIIDEQRDVFYCLHEDEVEYGFPALSKNYSFHADPAPEAGESDAS